MSQFCIHCRKFSPTVMTVSLAVVYHFYGKGHMAGKSTQQQQQLFSLSTQCKHLAHWFILPPSWSGLKVEVHTLTRS